MTTNLNELAGALAKAQAAMDHAQKSSTNPYFKSKYADLAEVWDTIRKPLTDNGLSIVQTTEPREDGKLYLKTTLLHASGQSIDGIYPIQPVKSDPQSLGAATTYARRFALQAIVGVSPEDDDGNTASGRTEPETEPTGPNQVAVLLEDIRFEMKRRGWTVEQLQKDAKTMYGKDKVSQLTVNELQGLKTMMTKNPPSQEKAE